ncbi:MAG: translation initiation factor IF-2 [Clostridia bacterium]|nr:translation initiation factor IF-2 [Clostridia bacterium]
MATKTNKIAIAQLSKDFNMKSKEVQDTFKDMGMEKKTSADPDEVELFLQKITLSHQIKNLDDYIDGKAKISVIDEPKEDSPQTDAPKAEVNPAPKAQAPKPEVKAEAIPEVKPEVKAEAQRPAAQEQRPQNRPAGVNGQNNNERRSFNNGQQGGDRRPFGSQNGQQNGERRPFNGQNGERRPFNGQNGQYGDRRNGFNQQGGDRRSFGGQNGQQNGYNKYSAAPQANPFAKKYDNMNRQASGMRNPNAAPKPDPNPTRPAQQALLEKQQRIARAQEAAKAAQAEPKAAPKKEEKKVQKQQYKTITPTVNTNAKGGVNLDAGDYQATAPKTRVVDMRTSDVNLSKYDDHYNDQFYAIANGDTAASKQKLKKQDNKNQNAKSAKDKQRAAAEKIKKMEAELARKKQLEIEVPDEITLSELASRMKKTSAEVIKKLMMMGEMKGVNDVIDYDTAELIATEFGVKVTKEVVVTIEEKLFTEAEENEADLIERAPVVCVMGHVDHGKTSILDAIRHTNVTKGEAGGITQASGAYRVKVNGKDVTFLDTPGHEAFTAMRMRGAKSTDIAILVVAADDGIMPQTIEAINHAKAAGVDIIVAINKMDKPTANPDNVLNQLTQYELVPEAWGGDVICVPCSAITGMGIQELLESVLLVAEVKELRANPNRRAKGIVIESRLDKGCGPVATILVQNGTLHQGDYVIVGNAVGRVRNMKDDKGRSIKVAGPSVPVEITGLDDVPQAGDELNGVEDEKMAKDLAEQRRAQQRADILAANARVNLDDLFSQISEGVQTLNIIVKADVAGSAEAVKASLLKLSTEEVKVNVIHSAVGGIIESDVMLAAASNAIIVGFNVRPDKNALDSAERNKVDIRTHRIIYEIIDEIEAAMKGLLAPTFKEALLGHATVRQTIRVPSVGTIAGSYVTDGKITRNAQIRIVRDGIVIFEDKIASLRRFKDDVKEVAEGYECGVGLEKFNDIKENDIMEAFIMEEVKA